MLVDQALTLAGVDPEVFNRSRKYYDNSGELNYALGPVFEADARDQEIPDIKLTKEETLKAIMFVTELRFDHIEKLVQAGVSNRYDQLVRYAVAKSLRSFFSDQLYLNQGVEEK